MATKDFIAYQESAESIVSKLQSDVTNGLSDAEVSARQAQYGLNELEAEEKTTLLQKFFAQFKDFMIIVLLVAALISVIAEGMHGLTDAIIILLVVVLNAIMGVFQEAKAEEAIDALRQMASPSARVRRNGNVTSVKSTELVPGDIVLLEAGDVVPADVRLIEANSLQIEEAALTGESVPTEKEVAPLEPGEEAGIGDRKNMAFSSTNVTYGRGLAVVTGTGMDTEVGHIAKMLASTEKQVTPLQRDQENLGKTLTILILIIAAVTFVMGLLRGRPALDMLLVAISLAVAAIPEGLPAISTIILSLGTRTMADRKALVRTLPAVETLGSTQVICSDKTGTLTVNKMTIEKVYYNGQLHDAADAIDLNTPLLKAITFANDTEIDAEGNLIGDPTETAMIKYALDKSLDLKTALAKTPRVDEVPFDSTRKLMSTIHRLEDGKYFVAVKGAPDQLLNRCTLIEKDGQYVPITEADRQAILSQNTELAKDALRVLGGAYTVLDSLPSEIKSETIENNLVFAGLVGMIDPERKEAGDAIRVAKGAGIRTVMITGDHAVTAQAIAERLGILDPNATDNDSHVLTGAELDEISDDQLAKQVQNYSVYARVSPEHKVRIIRAWQANDVVVSMTGDGVNDAPSLKQADIGVGMGITGTEVSKGASDMVLADDNFETIVVAVEEGRKVFSNIQKAVQFLLSANLGEVITLFVATMLGWQILEPVHILWINLVTDVFPAIALGMEKAEKGTMKQAPRTSKDNFLSFGVLPSIIYQGILEGAITLFVYWYATHVAMLDNIYGETMAFLTLGMIQLFHSYNVKSVFHSLFSSNPFANKYLNFAFLGSGSLLLIVEATPFLRDLFGVVELSSNEWLIVIGAAASILVFVEVIKFILRATGIAAKFEKSGADFQV